MATTTTTSSASAHLLTQQIQQHLDTELLDTANFLAGRLHALEPRNPDSAHLLALTYLRLRRFKAAADSAHKFGSNGRHLGCAYVFAQACLHLGRNGEGATALEKSKTTWTAKTPQRQRFLPDAAAGWTLLGKLWQEHGDPKKAGDCFVEAHKANPFTWEAFEGLCKVGADLNVQNMFRPAPDMLAESHPLTTTHTGRGSDEIYTDEQDAAPKPLAQQLNFNSQVFTPSADPFGISAKPIGFDLELAGKGKARPPKPQLSEWDTPITNSGSAFGEADDVAMGGVLADAEGVAVLPPRAPARRPRPGQQHLEPGERPRQPTLRGHGVSASEGTEETNITQHQRKPSGAAAIGGHKRTVSGQHASTDMTVAGQHPATRRSNRLFGQGTATTTSTRSTNFSRPTAEESQASVAGTRPAKTATGTKGRIGSTVGRVVSGNRKILPPDRNGQKEGEKEKRAPSRTIEREKTVITADSKLSTQHTKAKLAATVKVPTSAPQPDYMTITSILDGLRPLALAAYTLSRSDHSTAFQTIRSLSSSQRDTPYVLALLAKAHYVAANYKTSEEVFAKLLKLQPTRTQDMEIYSTVLWHLKKDAPLAFLCHFLRDLDPNAPETWVAAGNAFSLSREHDAAISAFRRAVQLDAKFAYAWTLMGHEYMANEDFDSAVSAFRHAVSADQRGYGGWYGLGKCAERVGSLEDAERHYRIAVSLSPSNSTLQVCVGVVLDRLRNPRAALTWYTKALELAPGSALARFKRARVLMHLRCFEEAKQELEVLRELAPEEANVWFLLGKCYRRLGERGEGLRCFTCALNLDGKAAPLIKEAMEAMDESEEEEGEDEGIEIGEGDETS